jgi:hypothetical protein
MPKGQQRGRIYHKTEAMLAPGMPDYTQSTCVQKVNQVSYNAPMVAVRLASSLNEHAACEIDEFVKDPRHDNVLLCELTSANSS